MKTSIGVGGYARGDITGALNYVQAADRAGVAAASSPSLGPLLSRAGRVWVCSALAAVAIAVPMAVPNRAGAAVDRSKRLPRRSLQQRERRHA